MRRALRILVSPAMEQREWTWRFDGVDYSLGVADDRTVQYLSTRSTKVVTREGAHVGQSFSDLKRIQGIRVVA